MEWNVSILPQNDADHLFFEASRGYGLVDARSVTGRTKAEQALFAGNWNLRDSVRDRYTPDYDVREEGVYLKQPQDVMIYKIMVPGEGTWRVHLKIRAAAGPVSELAVFAGRRNVIARRQSVPAGEERTFSFLTAVTPYYPAMRSIPNTENAVFVSLCGKNAGISEITVQKEEAPVIYVAGDSTLTDQNAPFPYYPFGSCGGWAQALAAYFPNAAVCNQAHSGMTTNCFRDDGHWEIILKRLKKGDLVLFQFGHNDQKRRYLSAFGGYSANLRRYAAEVRERGAIPVFLSPISRIPFEDRGRMRSLLGAYAEAVREAADELEIPFIDLHEKTFAEWCTRKQTAGDFFLPGDLTHTNDYGAHLIAGIVFRNLKRMEAVPEEWMISDEELSDEKAFLPGAEDRELPAEPPGPGLFEMPMPFVDIAGLRQYPQLAKAMRFGLLDPCVIFLHPKRIMPRGQFLMVYLKALRLPGKRPYEGAFCDLSRYEWDSAFAQTCIEENLIDPATVTDTKFRPDDPLTAEEFASFLVRGMQRSAGARDIDISSCMTTAVLAGLVPENLRPKDPVTRADCYAGLAVLMELLDNEKKALPAGTEIHPVR